MIHVLSPVHYISAHVSWWSEGELYQSLNIDVSGRQAGSAPLAGKLHADLFLISGELVTLEVDSPSLHYRVIDREGRESVRPSDARFGEPAVLRWIGASGLNPSDREVHAWALAACSKIGNMLALRLESVPRSIEAQSGFKDGASSFFGDSLDFSTNSFSGPPAYAIPTAVMGWSVLWLGGLQLILRRGARKSPPDPSNVGVAS